MHHTYTQSLKHSLELRQISTCPLYVSPLLDCQQHMMYLESSLKCSPNNYIWFKDFPEFDAAKHEISQFPICQSFCESFYDACSDQSICTTLSSKVLLGLSLLYNTLIQSQSGLPAVFQWHVMLSRTRAPVPSISSSTKPK